MVVGIERDKLGGETGFGAEASSEKGGMSLTGETERNVGRGQTA